MHKITPFCSNIYIDTITNVDKGYVVDYINVLVAETSGVNKSNALGWQSQEYDENSHLVFLPLIHEIKQRLTPIYREYGINRAPSLGSYWINVNNKHSYNKSHNHPGSFFSVAYYLKVPSDSGNIVFERTDMLRDYIIPDTITESNWGEYWITPSEDNIVMFPSFMRHYVDMNVSDEDDTTRISLAFNFR